MREMLFRGQKVDTKEWVYGHYYHDIVRDGFNPEKPILFEKDFIRLIESKNMFMAYEVIPETVGEFAGLTDKNGVKIFEGDVCIFIDHPTNAESATSTVVFFEGSFVNEYFGCAINYYGSDWIEVIGNIHDKHVL